MDKEFFKTQITKLSNVYGAKNYPPDRSNVIWRELYYLPNDDFSRLVDELIASKRFAPMINDFRESGLCNLKSSRLEKIESIKKSSYCSLCGNTGSLSVLGKEQRCSCALGEPGLCLPDYIKRFSGDSV